METKVLVKGIVRGTFSHEPFFCTPRSIDKSGMLIAADKTLAKGDVVHCSLFFPDLHRMRTFAQVMSVARRGEGVNHYGLRFLGLSREQQEHLDARIHGPGSL